MADIIAAISTALAPSGIGVIRLSGDNCARTAAEILTPVHGKPLPEAVPRKLCLYDLHDRQGRIIDRILAVYTPGPHSYTGEDTVELQCHGSPAVLTEALSALFQHGARQAGPGEFTKRAFLNGQMDLTAAEAVIDLIEAETADAAANAAGQVGGALLRKLDPIYEALVSMMSHFHAVLDYPDEDIDDFSLQNYAALLDTQIDALEQLLSTCQRGQIVRNGVKSVILGRPNAGKSSLLNALAGYERVIVTDIPGTTRDTVEEKIRMGGLILRLIDTAGIRKTNDVVENIGIERTFQKMEEARIIIWLLDELPAESEIDEMEKKNQGKKLLMVFNKIDALSFDPTSLSFHYSAQSADKNSLASSPSSSPASISILSISARTGENIPLLEKALVEAADIPEISENDVIVTSARHYEALIRANESLSRVLESMNIGMSGDIIAEDLKIVLEELGEITGGQISSQETLNNIFKHFCIGK